MGNNVQKISVDKLVGYAGNPNRMSKVNFGKLVRNIQRSGLYEPLIVRPCPKRRDCFEIIDGHHRLKALVQLGYKEVECIVWEVDDEQMEILVATLNRLRGTDELSKRLSLLRASNKMNLTTDSNI